MPVGRFGTTDDMGHFRMYGLAPGDYYISATLRPGGGMGFEVGPSDITTGYAPTYYPGTASSQQADRITVGLGGEMSGITFSLLPVRTVKVSGTAVDSSGKPMAGAFVMLSADMRSGDGGFMMFGGGGNQVKDDGTFSISNVTPGDYVVRAMTMGGPRRGDDEAESATVSVSVGAEDVTGVTLIGTKGTSLRGQVVVQPASAATGIKPSEVSVHAMAKDPDAPMMFMGGGMMRDRVDDDWTFEVRTTQSPVLIRTMRTPAGYSLKAVLHNGTDVTDTGIAFKPGETVTGLQVVLSTTSSGVAGGVTDDSGRPVADYAVDRVRGGLDQVGLHVEARRDGPPGSAGRIPGEEPASGPVSGSSGRGGRGRSGDRPGVPRTPAAARDGVHARRRGAAICGSEDRASVLKRRNYKSGHGPHMTPTHRHCHRRT